MEDKTYCFHTKKALGAAEAIVNLYALPCSIINHTPLSICGIVLSILANLSACSYILTGSEWYRTRDRVRLGLGCLKTFSEVWEVSRRTEKETKKIARTVFAMPRPDIETSWTGSFEAAGGSKLWVQPPQQELAAGWSDLAELDYSGLFSGIEQGSWYGAPNPGSNGY